MSAPDALAVLALVGTLAGMRVLALRWSRQGEEERRRAGASRPPEHETPVRIEYDQRPPAPVVIHRTLPPARVEVGAPEPLELEDGR